MNSVIASWASSSVVVAPAGSSSPSIMSSRVSPSRSIVIWHGHELHAEICAISSSSLRARDLVLLGELPHHRRAGASEVHLRRASGAPCPGRSIIASIFCIQLSPVMRTSSFTSGNSPQNVKKIVVSIPMAAPVVAEDQRRPDLVQVAAPGDDHELLCGTWSGRRSGWPRERASSASSAISSPLPDHEPEHAVRLGLLHELVAGRRRTRPRSRRPTRGRWRATSISSPDCELPDRLCRLRDRQRAANPFMSSVSAIVAVIALSFVGSVGRSGSLRDPALGHGLPVQAVEHPLRRVPRPCGCGGTGGCS